jgi:putative sterol carrier protein
MNITGEGGGEWFINVSDSGPSIKGGTEAADCTITIASEDFQKLHENPQAQGMQLFFAGKLKVAGNQMLAMKLSKLFTLGAA